MHNALTERKGCDVIPRIVLGAERPPAKSNVLNRATQPATCKSTQQKDEGQMRYVFVYGTLRAGEINDIGLAAARHGMSAPRLIGPVAVAGRLYDLGDYPGLVRDDAAGPVRGDVYEIDEALVPVLDRIEGIEPGGDGVFKSREIVVTVKGRQLPCFFYPVDEVSVGGRTRIQAGDWVSYRLARDSVAALKYGS